MLRPTARRLARPLSSSSSPLSTPATSNPSPNPSPAIPSFARTHGELLQMLPEYKDSYADEMNCRFDTAAINMGRCQGVLESVMGASSPLALHVNLKAAHLHYLRGDMAKAEATLKANLNAPRPVDVSVGYQYLSQMRLLQGDMSGALQAAKQALEVLGSQAGSAAAAGEGPQEAERLALGHQAHISHGLVGKMITRSQ